MTGKMTILKGMNTHISGKGFVCFFIFLFFCVSALFAVVPEKIVKIPLPSTAMARRQLAPVITGSLREAESLLPTVFQDGVHGNFINFFTREEQGNITFYFSLDSGIDFKKVKKGSCVVVRNLSPEKGKKIQEIRFYIKDDNKSYVRIVPDAALHDSLLSIRLYGYQMQENIKIPLPITTVLRTPFDTIERLTSGYVNWGFYLPDPLFIYSDDVRQLSMRIISLLRFLHDSDDGAINKNGRFVSISTLKEQKGVGGLNCSGFAKWVIDGLYYPRKGTYLDLSVLKKKHLEVRGNKWSKKLEDKYDPYFGLDWTRNLAWEYAKTYNPEVGYRSSDVNNLSFQTYVNNVGFPLKKLKVILYELAVSEPEYFYLGAVSMITENPPGLRRYLHVLVLLPYIDSSGKFVYRILSRNENVSLEEMEKRYPDSFVHLVRIRASNRFEPSGIKFDPVLRRLF